MEDEPEDVVEVPTEVASALYALKCVRGVGTSPDAGDYTLTVVVDDLDRNEDIVAELLEELGIKHFKVREHEKESHE